MKKWTVGIFSSLLLLGAGTATFAQTSMPGTMNMHTNIHGNSTINFEEMKPVLKEMHPKFSDNELNEMFNSCHKE